MGINPPPDMPANSPEKAPSVEELTEFYRKIPSASCGCWVKKEPKMQGQDEQPPDRHPGQQEGRSEFNYSMPPELLQAMREIVRIAIMTLAALRDPDRRYQGFASMPQNVVHDVREAYGYSSATVREFIPSAFHISQMEVVLPWLAWVRREEGKWLSGGSSVGPWVGRCGASGCARSAKTEPS